MNSYTDVRRLTFSQHGMCDEERSKYDYLNCHGKLKNYLDENNGCNRCRRCQWVLPASASSKRHQRKALPRHRGAEWLALPGMATVK